MCFFKGFSVFDRREWPIHVSFVSNPVFHVEVYTIVAFYHPTIRNQVNFVCIRVAEVSGWLMLLVTCLSLSQNRKRILYL